jgi:hypothetical protein
MAPDRDATRRHTRRDFFIASAGASLLLLSRCSSSDDKSEPRPTARYFLNPADSRAVQVTVNGQVITYFGPKNAGGDLEYVAHATIDAADGNPSKRVSYDFAANGDPTRATMATGETMFFAWPSTNKVIVTYRTADGAQETRFPYDLATGTASATTDVVVARRTPLSDVRKAALEARPAAEHLGTATSADTASPMSRGVVEVVCGGGAPVDEATVTGYVVIPTNVSDERSDLVFTEYGPGLFEYSLPMAPATNTDVSYRRAQVEAAIGLLCKGNVVKLVVGAEAICLVLVAVPGIGAIGAGTCALLVAAASLLCTARTTENAVAVGVDLFAQTYLVTAIAHHSKLGTTETHLTAKAGQAIPKGTLTFSKGAAISSLTTDPFDPAEDEDYTITARTTCAGAGYTVTLSLVGSDGYTDSKTVALSTTVSSVTLAVPGGQRGVRDRFTAKLTGTTSDTKESSITF